MKTLVAPLTAITRDGLAFAGGKGANLGELLAAGLPVPDGYVVTTDAYADAVERTGLAGRIPRLLADGDAAGVRAGFAAAEIPEATAEAIVKAYHELGQGPVAVRSSATAEDLPGAAFAGQQDTYLNVVGVDALLDAVRRCWGSLWTDRAIAYRRRLRIAPEEVRIAVVVQRMVDAAAAGVMFTADPVSGDRNRIVVDASGGLGEAVVSGRVTPDHYELDARGGVLAWTPGRAEVVIRGVAGGGVVEEAGRPREGRLLDDATLAELAHLGVAVQDRYGRPMDIEWALADGRVWLVQARPMTALPPPPVRLNMIQRRLGEMLLDYLPTRPYPMDMSTWLPYGPLGMMVEVARSLGVRGLFEGAIEERDGVAYRVLPRPPRPTPKALTAPFRVLHRARRYDPARWTEDPRFTAFRDRIAELRRLDLAALPWPELVRVPRRALGAVRPITELRRDYLPRCAVSVARLVLSLRPLGAASLLPTLLVGLRTRTEDGNRALEALAAEVRENPALKDAVDALDLARVRESGPFWDAFTAFLDEYGHRETGSPILVSPPTWEERPEIVLGMIKVLAASPPSPPAVDQARDAVRRLMSHPRLRSERRRARMMRRIEAVRAANAFREDSHFYFTMPLPVLRRALLEIGERLRAAGVLAAAEDVFHLRLEEVEAAGDPAAMPAARRDELAAAVRARAARREELAGVRLLDPRAVYPDRGERDGDALVRGTPGGGGTATGPVRVIRDPAEFGLLKEGEVLVCPNTNPAWTPLFQRAVAVVVDSGGIASHAAIVAREYGLPAIMGTVNGTSVLADGQVVTVDGDLGTVREAS